MHHSSVPTNIRKLNNKMKRTQYFRRCSFHSSEHLAHKPKQHAGSFSAHQFWRELHCPWPRPRRPGRKPHLTLQRGGWPSQSPGPEMLQHLDGGSRNKQTDIWDETTMWVHVRMQVCCFYRWQLQKTWGHTGGVEGVHRVALSAIQLLCWVLFVIFQQVLDIMSATEQLTTQTMIDKTLVRFSTVGSWPKSVSQKLVGSFLHLKNTIAKYLYWLRKCWGFILQDSLLISIISKICWYSMYNKYQFLIRKIVWVLKETTLEPSDSSSFSNIHKYDGISLVRSSLRV